MPKESPFNADALLRKYRKKHLFDPKALKTQINYGQSDIQKIIPHRSPMLFVHRITALDWEQGNIAGERVIESNDPVFQGHFPNFPVYPGNFTLETIGQMGLCMYYFLENERSDIASDAEPVHTRASRILGAHYIEPISPGDTVILLAQKLHSDGIFASVIGQAIVNEKVAVVAIGEVVIL